MSIRTLCIAIISIVVGYLLIGQNLQAKFFYIDDHEIPFYLNGKERMELKDFNQALAKTEFYGFGKGARFRPAYSFFRITETALWGDNPFLWYASRLIMFILSFFVFWIILKRYVGIIPGFLIIMYTLTFPFWTDIWARMGPGEVYCVPALSLFIWSYLNILEGKRTYLSWMVLATTSFSIVGSKETFAFLIFFILFLDGYLYSKKRFDINAAIYSFISLLLIGYVLVGVGLYVYNTGNDFYMNSVDFNIRFLQLIENIVTHSTHYWNKLYPFNYLGIVFSICLLFILTKKMISLAKTTKKCITICIWKLFWIISLTAVMVISQIYFYNGVWPTNIRYDFPGMLFIPIFITVFYYFLRKISVLLYSKRIGQILSVAFCLFLTGLIYKNGYHPIIFASEANATRTIEFTLRLTQIKNDVSKDKEIPIVLESCSQQDLEFITALNRFLFGSFLNRTVFLSTHYTTPPKSNLDTHLVHTLTEKSIHGDTVFTPLEAIPTSNNCYSINLSCETVTCEKGTSLVQPWCISETNPGYSSPNRKKLPNSTCLL